MGDADQRQMPRQQVGALLSGRVLEVGPGHDPFPTATGAVVTFADHSVEGGRDQTWPELAGEPHGPRADLDVDLNVSGLQGVGDETFDVVIACHVIEHLANPLAVLREFQRVLVPGGRLVLVVPDRSLTFDAPRPPTSFAHLREEHALGVAEVDEAHIREFCEAIYAQPSIHPPPVRSWHDPSRLDADLLALHRRRSIHAHCWGPEEFASLLTAAAAHDIVAWELDDLYVAGDSVDAPSVEFGLVLRKASLPCPPSDVALRFAVAWSAQIVSRPARDPDHVARFMTALRADLADTDCLASIAVGCAELLARGIGRIGRAEGAMRRANDELAQRAADAAADAARWQTEADRLRGQLDPILRSRAFAFATTVAAFRRKVDASAARRVAGLQSRRPTRG